MKDQEISECVCGHEDIKHRDDIGCTVCSGDFVMVCDCRAFRPKPPKESPKEVSECRLPKKCEVKDCHNGFITRFIGGSIDSEACPCACHHFPEPSLDSLVEGLRELFISILPAAKKQKLASGNDYEQCFWWNAAREEMIKNIKSLPPEAFTEVINKAKKK